MEPASGLRQVLQNIDVALPRMGVISGQITDALGEPMAGVWSPRTLNRLNAIRAGLPRAGRRRNVAQMP